MHTCYAPVRYSSSLYCYKMLPFNLHVLSLPPAFILSQDQTLLSIIYLYLNITVKVIFRCVCPELCYLLLKRFSGIFAADLHSFKELVPKKEALNVQPFWGMQKYNFFLYIKQNILNIFYYSKSLNKKLLYKLSKFFMV